LVEDGIGFALHAECRVGRHLVVGVGADGGIGHLKLGHGNLGACKERMLVASTASATECNGVQVVLALVHVQLALNGVGARGGRPWRKRRLCDWNQTRIRHILTKYFNLNKMRHRQPPTHFMSFKMDDNQRLQLQNMIKANNVEDQTNLIRNLKHSQLLREEVNNLLLIKNKYKDDEDKIQEEGVNECNFLFTYYTDIYNKLRKDELDVGMLYKFLDVLKRVEDGELDQHEGSFLVGTILKEMYVDSALRKAEKLNAQEEGEKPEPTKAQTSMSWKEFKTSSVASEFATSTFTPIEPARVHHSKKKQDKKPKAKRNYRVN
jgi:hypothetical protein